MDQSFLSLGDMITFIGLIVAVYQLAKPRYVMLWKLSSTTLKTLAILLLIIGYLSPLAAIVTPDIKDIPFLWAKLSLSQLLQVYGFVLITVGSLIIAYIYSRHNRSHLLTTFTKYKQNANRFPKKNWRVFNFQLERNKTVTTRSAEKFYAITSRYLVRGNIEEVVEIIHYNLKSLVLSARQYNPHRFRLKPETDEVKKPEIVGSNYTFETLYQILTDDAVMKHICSSNRPFLHALVWHENEVAGGYLNNELASVIYQNVMEHLILNTNSYLYTQAETQNGSARFANIYELLTDDRIITRQHVIPSQLTWHVSNSEVPFDKYVDVMSKLLERMVASYKISPNEQVLKNIAAIMNQLMGDDGVTRRIAYDAKASERFDGDIVNSVEAKVLRTIEMDVVHRLFSSDDPDSFKNSKSELKALNTRSVYDQHTLTGLAAHKVSELIEDLTVLYDDTKHSGFNIRRAMFDCLHIYADTPVANHYKQLLIDRLFDKAVDGKIEEFTTNIKGYYPNVFRALVEYLIPFTPRNDAIDTLAQNRLKSVMANELKEALLNSRKMRSGEPMQNELLPPDVTVTINKSKKTVKYYFVNKKGTKQLIDLNEKPVAKIEPKPRKSSKK